MLNRIYNEDCIEGMKQIPAGSVDMVLCDPPYGNTDNEWDVKLPMDEVFEEYLRVCKENAAIVIFAQMPFGAELIMSQPKLYRYEWIWEKNCAVGFLNANKMPLRAHENILVFYRKLPTYNPQWGKGKPYVRINKSVQHGCYRDVPRILGVNNGRRYPRDVLKDWVMRGFNFRTLHPTQKPVGVLEYLIKTYTNEGETVLDNCMGSGSTAVACINTNRNYIGFETEKKYYDIALERIEEAKQGAEPIEDAKQGAEPIEDADNSFVLEGFG